MILIQQVERAAGVIVIATMLAVVFSCVYSMMKLYAIARRYKRFYKNTETGKLLHSCLYTRKNLREEAEWHKARINVCQAKMAVYRVRQCDFLFECYAEENASREQELAAIITDIRSLDVRIGKIIASLPKKYQGILEYDWEKVDVEYPNEGQQGG